MSIHQELKLIKERRSKSTGLLSRIYQYRNFEIEVETDTLGALPAECRIRIIEYRNFLLAFVLVKSLS